MLLSYKNNFKLFNISLFTLHEKKMQWITIHLPNQEIGTQSSQVVLFLFVYPLESPTGACVWGKVVNKVILNLPPYRNCGHFPCWSSLGLNEMPKMSSKSLH